MHSFFSIIHSISLLHYCMQMRIATFHVTWGTKSHDIFHIHSIKFFPQERYTNLIPFIKAITANQQGAALGPLTRIIGQEKKLH